MAGAKLFDAKMRKKMLAMVTKPRDARNEAGLNQANFWRHFGVTQSGGSRYESGRAIPGPAQLLMALHAAGKITNEDLLSTQEVLGASFKASTD